MSSKDNKGKGKDTPKNKDSDLKGKVQSYLAGKGKLEDVDDSAWEDTPKKSEPAKTSSVGAESAVDKRQQQKERERARIESERKAKEEQQKAKEVERKAKEEETAKRRKAAQDKADQERRELAAIQEKTEILKAELKRFVDERERGKKDRDVLENGIKSNEMRIDSIVTEIRGKIKELETGEKPAVEAPKIEEPAPKASAGGLFGQILGAPKLKSKPKEESTEKAKAAPVQDPLMAALQERMAAQRRGVSGKVKKTETSSPIPAKFVPPAKKKAVTHEDKLAEEHKKIQETVDTIKRVQEEISKINGSIAALDEHNKLQKGIILDLENRRNAVDERYQKYINAKLAASSVQAGSTTSEAVPAAPLMEGAPEAPPFDAPPFDAPPAAPPMEAPEAPPFDAPPAAPPMEAPEAPPFDAPPYTTPTASTAAAAPTRVPKKESRGKTEETENTSSKPAASANVIKQIQYRGLFKEINAVIRNPNSEHFQVVKNAIQSLEPPVNVPLDKVDISSIGESAQDKIIAAYQISVQELKEKEEEKEMEAERKRNAEKAQREREAKAEKERHKQSVIDEFLKDVRIPEPQKDTAAVERLAEYQKESPQKTNEFAVLTETSLNDLLDRAYKREGVAPLETSGVVPPEPVSVVPSASKRVSSPESVSSPEPVTVAPTVTVASKESVTVGPQENPVAPITPIAGEKTQTAEVPVTTTEPTVTVTPRIAVAEVQAVAEAAPAEVPTETEVSKERPEETRTFVETKPAVETSTSVETKPSEETRPSMEAKPEVTARIEELKQKREAEEKYRSEFLVQSRAGQQGKEVEQEIKSREEVRQEEQEKSERLEREKKVLDQKKHELTLSFDKAEDKEARDKAVAKGVDQMQAFKTTIGNAIKVYYAKHENTETKKVLGFSVGSDQNVKREIATYIQKIFLKIIEDHIKNKKLFTDKEINGLIKDLDHQIKKNEKARGLMSGKGELAPILQDIKATLINFQKTKEFTPPRGSAAAKQEGPKIEDH